MPAGPVSRDEFEAQMADTIRDLVAAVSAGPLDGVLLSLHGAMVVEGIEDGEAEYVRRIRQVTGDDLPIGAVLDLHANTSVEFTELVDLLVGYDTYPHVDGYDRALELAELLVRRVKRQIKPTFAFRKIPILSDLPAQFTSRAPMSELIALCHEIEGRPGVLTATIAGGFPYADISDTGMSVYVATDDNQAEAERCANELAQFAWEHRAGFQSKPTPIDEAVRYALSRPGPILLADVADNTGAGTAGDGTEILRALIKHAARSAVVALIYDPETVLQAVKAGVGGTIEATIGGKVDDKHGPPIKATAYVRTITDGFFRNTGPMGTGLATNMGTTVVLEIGGREGIEVVCSMHRHPPNDQGALRSVGIDPERRQVVVIKSSVHYRAHYTPIVREIIEVDAPGLSAANWNRFAFKRIPRPTYPLDGDFQWNGWQTSSASVTKAIEAGTRIK
jgi:microcystin degradation protein MlrC